MTGRKLYDKYCDIAKDTYAYNMQRGVLANDLRVPAAWPYLDRRDRSIWNRLARATTLKPRPKS